MRVAVLGRPGTALAGRAAAAGHNAHYAELVRGAHAELPPGVLRAPTLEEAVREAELVVDFVPDELESKLEILTLMDRMAPPGAILVTPLEHLSVADLASCTYRGERVFGCRLLLGALEGEGTFAVETITTARSDQGCLEQVQIFWLSLGAEARQSADLSALP